MIKVIVARNDDKVFERYLKPSLEKFGSKIELFGIPNSEQMNSMFKKYNEGIKISNPADDDIVVFVHEDVKILDEHFCEKLQLIFEKRKEVGLVGIIGTKELDSMGWWINDRKHHVGRWIQGYDDGTEREMIRKIGYDENMLVVDGCCFAVRGKVAKEVPFLEDQFPQFFHFYDYSYSLSVLEAKWKVAVADILIFHKSEGALPTNWHLAREVFCNYYISKGYKFPITKDQIK